MENADIVLMDSDLRKLVLACQLAREVLRTIRLNISFAVLSKLAMVVFTVLGHVSLWAAVAADVGSMLLVTLHGMKILRKRRVRGVPGEPLAPASLDVEQPQEAVEEIAAPPPVPVLPPPVPVEESAAHLSKNMCADFGRKLRAPKKKRHFPLGGEVQQLVPATGETPDAKVKPLSPTTGAAPEVLGRTFVPDDV
eukprot:3397230-Amphidinium_carterae.1